MTEQIVPPAPPPPKRSFFQNTMRALLVIVIILILLAVFLVSFTQTSWFRNIVRSQIENFVENNTHGKLSIGRIDGDLINGFTIYDAHLKLRGADSTEIASIKEIYARYSIWRFINGSEIPVTTLIMRTPVIRFVKLPGDSLWNYQRFIPISLTPGSPTPFNLKIDVQDLRLENGELFVHDYNPRITAVQPEEKSSIDWGDFILEDINLDMNAHVNGEKMQKAQIYNLSFLTHGRDSTPLRVHHLELIADHNDEHLEISNLHLITDRSDIHLTAVMDPFRVLNGEPFDSLAHTPTKLLLTANSVNEKELRQFLPDLSFLEGSPSIEIAAEGEFGKLKITKGALGFRNDGTITFSGELRNLHDPDHFYLDVVLKAHNLSDRTLRNYVPGLQIPDIQRFGTVNIDRLTFVGYPENFNTTFDIHSSNGAINGKAALDLRSAQLIYDANISTKNVNLARLLDDPSLESDLNSTLTIKGKGTDPKTMQAEFQLDGAGTTAFKNYQIEKFHIGGNIASAHLTLQNTEIILQSGASLHSSYATIDFSRETPTYDFEVVTKNLPVTDFAPIFPRSSRVSVDATLSGGGTSANNLVGSINAEISGLEQDNKPLPNIKLTATLERDSNGSGRRLDMITSSIADLTFRGKYNIETIGSIIGDRIQKISTSIKNRSNHSNDTLSVFGTNTFSCTDSIDLSYTANIKDLRPIAPFIPNMLLLGNGKLNGSVKGCENGEIAIATDGDIHNFLMRSRNQASDSSGLPPMRLKDTKLSFFLEQIGNRESTLLHSLKADLKIHSDSTQRISGVFIDKPDMTTHLENGNLNYSINTMLKPNMAIHVSGIGNISNSDLVFQPDSLSVGFGGPFVWYNDKKPRITIASDGSVEIDTLSMIKEKAGYDPDHKFAQKIVTGFRIKGDSIIYAYLETPQFDLSEIAKFFPNPESMSELNNMRGRVNYMNVRMDGSFSHPHIAAELAVRNVAYNNVTIDSGRINLLYKDLTLSGNANFHVDTADFSKESIRQGREVFIAHGDNSFRLDIKSVPLLFSLKRYPGYSADSAAVSKRQIDITASAKDYPLDMFSPFVPVIADLHGLSDIELTINGTQENILYKGSVDIRQGSMLLPTTNLRYTMNGKLLLSSEELRFVDMNLANFPGDDPDGRGVLTGSFFFKGFNVESFKLYLSTNRLTVLNAASQETIKEVYGPLAIRTVGDPLTFSGTFDRPILTGDIFVISGNLILPQSYVSSAALLNDGILYRIKDNGEMTDLTDSAGLNQPADSLRDSTQLEYSGEQNFDDYDDPAFERVPPTTTDTTRTVMTNVQFTPAQLSFQDKMLYALNISSSGNLWITLNFSKFYGLFDMILTAEIKTDGILTFTRSEPGEIYSYDGKILLTDKSTFRFYNKDFSPVTGSIDFVKGNSTLDIIAEYTGPHKVSGSGDETIKIKLTITGTISEPELAMDLYRKNGQEFVKDLRTDEQVRADVLSYLASGTLAGDQQGGANSNPFADAGASILSGQVSRFASNYLSQTGLIKSFGLELGGASVIQNLKVTGGFKNLLFSYGRTTNSGSGVISNDFTAEWPISDNLSVTGEYHPNTSFGSSGLTQQPLVLFRGLYRFP